MKILVYGAGAVGLGIGTTLVKAGCDVTFVGREETVAALEKEGLMVTGIFGDFRVPAGSIRAYSELSSVGEGSFDFVLVTTKAHGSEVAARDIASRMEILGENGYVLLIHNGWGSAEIFAELIPEEKILSARLITGFVRKKPNVVTCTVHADAIRLGNLFGDPPRELEALAEAVRRGGIPCEVTSEVERYLWAKLLYNCALNPTGALFEATYGELADSPFTRKVMNDVIRECYGVMRAGGWSTFWDTAEGYMEIFYGELVPPTASHVSSMVIDIREGRKTEIDFLNGAIVRIGKERGVPVPVNETVYGMIRFLEERGGKE